MPRNKRPLPVFDAATSNQRAAQIAHTRLLSQIGQSDAERWRDPAMHSALWAARTVALVQMIHPNESVFEFGAGQACARDVLPADCFYVASDLEPIAPDVVRFDLNAETLERITGLEVALLSGVLEYVHCLPRTADFLARCFRSVVCSYAAAQEGSPEAIARRRYSGWFNDLSTSEFCRLFEDAGFALVSRGAWETQGLFRFELVDPPQSGRAGS